MPTSSKFFNISKESLISYGIVIAAALVYVSLTFLTPMSREAVEKYNFTPQGIFWLRVTIIIPILFIWSAGAFAVSALARYINLLKDSPEKSGFMKIFKGIEIIFWLSVASSMISVVASYLAGGEQTYELKPLVAIFTRYVGIFSLLSGLSYILSGVSLLFGGLKGVGISRLWKTVAVTAMIGVAYVFLELIFTNTVRTVPAGDIKTATYYLKDSLIVLTIVVPVFVSWVVGMVAAKKVSLYVSTVPGLIYRAFFKSFGWGVSMLILTSMFSQILSAVGAERLDEIGIGGILWLIYILIFIFATAYGFIAYGANKLSKIETA